MIEAVIFRERVGIVLTFPYLGPVFFVLNSPALNVGVHQSYIWRLGVVSSIVVFVGSIFIWLATV